MDTAADASSPKFNQTSETLRDAKIQLFFVNLDKSLTLDWDGERHRNWMKGLIETEK